MSDVKRYSAEWRESFEHPEGEYVKYEDYQALAARLEAVELVLGSLGAEYERTPEGIRWWRCDPDLPTNYTTIVEVK